MILLIDNYDSFTYNIYQFLVKKGREVCVKRNDETTLFEIEKLKPTHIIISPGPGRPESAGISVDIIKHFKGMIPVLGICLGHQCIGTAFGAEIVQAPSICHGKESEVSHDGKGIFTDIKNPLTVIRYHSLVIDKTTLPEKIQITALSEDGSVMGIRHSMYSIIGLQFHPESIGTDSGETLLENFIEYKHKKSVMQTAIRKVFKAEDLTENEASYVMDEITSGKATHAQIASLLTALSMKGESVSEITGFAKILRKRAISIKRSFAGTVVDTCGTGGDMSGTFNISTTAAFVTAGADVCVAKHGNRSITSRCGSADLLETLGVSINSPPPVVEKALEEIGIGFLFAPRMHPSMKHAVGVRREINIRTVFNILGPLANPADADAQIIGVFKEKLTEKIANVLIKIGIKNGMVVHGMDGIDEITLTTKTKISEIKEGWIKNYYFNPEDYGFYYCSKDDLKGGDLRTNAEITLAILKGKKGPKRDIVVLNSAAAIYVGKRAGNFAEAISAAINSIDSGAAQQKLDDLIRVSNGY